MSASPSHRVRVICLGNELVHDDGVGVRVGRALRELPLPEGTTVELRRALGLELLDELRPDEEIILIDASRTGSPPGTLHVMHLDQAAEFAGTPYCCHGVGIAEVLRLAARVAPESLPTRTVVIGVEAENLTSFGLVFSPPVRDAFPGAMEAALTALGASRELHELGQEAAARWQDWEPSIEDVIS
jgi:hydrogenase maturation protease